MSGFHIRFGVPQGSVLVLSLFTNAVLHESLQGHRVGHVIGFLSSD